MSQYFFFFFFLQIWKKFTNLIIFKIIQEIFFKNIIKDKKIVSKLFLKIFDFYIQSLIFM
ncbi:hypothetical protein DR098_03305 [Mycoplasma hyorhinis]|nr:hypothetical protein [Mesomycoplasma hyorhinis]